jgi:hypothetical protein
LYRRCRTSNPQIARRTPELDWRVHESAEYAAHGERPGAGANRYNPEREDLGVSADTAAPVSVDTTARTLPVIEDTSGLRPAAACEVLYDYGIHKAIAWMLRNHNVPAASRDDKVFCDEVVDRIDVVSRLPDLFPRILNRN